MPDGRRRSIVAAVALLCAALTTQLLGCSDDDNPTRTSSEPQPNILISQVLPSTGCKSQAEFETIGTNIPYQECLQFTYHFDRSLHFVHQNASFNCCVDSFAVNVSQAGNVITVCCRQVLLNGGCDCYCLYDLEYGIENLEPGEYRIKVFDPYHCSQVSYPEIEFTVNLNDIKSGAFCVTRYAEPWE